MVLVSLLRWQVIRREETVVSCTREGLDWVLKKYFHKRGSVEQAALGSSGFAIPEVFESHGCDA